MSGPSDEVREVTELITPGPAAALAGLLGVPPPDGDLPLLWHWVYLLDRRASRAGPARCISSPSAPRSARAGGSC